MSCASRSNPKELGKRPTLNEVLSDATPAPYTLNAFMTYLSENHCLETLQFTIAAKQYRETYNSFVDQAGEPIVTTDPSAGRHLRMLYQLLLTTYIIPGAPREVNLSSDVRGSLLRYKDQLTPPQPEALEPGVKHIHELMENSIFLLFLNSCATPSCQVLVPEASNMIDVKMDDSVTRSGNESTKSLSENSKRPFLSYHMRALSWPPWGRQRG
ncbi:unnamed protein product [Penicillium nalgiovense]|uniref:RGS domain-containing protein n=1 Tax=Penicillium nalgiovense TaxID=60175 RepID=A0A1V6X4X1_PENNA|nr:hypothetical protein PENNAL_c0121G04747 [Penicillium nalgiovense]CAG7938056.1 unnamed protein product [Penicillium nalgiovense]CAG7938977.1 unnamed protein product [Penicillium nalgiovense]CAG7940702.1 unnamed protein product [Penicillium nalgiovense]CAG7940791.1 unnamed protein product [Penicillium nalgiovense]